MKQEEQIRLYTEGSSREIITPNEKEQLRLFDQTSKKSTGGYWTDR